MHYDRCCIALGGRTYFDVFIGSEVMWPASGSAWLTEIQLMLSCCFCEIQVAVQHNNRLFSESSTFSRKQYNFDQVNESCITFHKAVRLTVFPGVVDKCIITCAKFLHYSVYQTLLQELIRRWDSERELLRIAPRKLPQFAEITQNNGHYAVQGHSRSAILIPIESSYTTSYKWLILTYLPSCTVSEI